MKRYEYDVYSSNDIDAFYTRLNLSGDKGYRVLNTNIHYDEADSATYTAIMERIVE